MRRRRRGELRGSRKKKKSTSLCCDVREFLIYFLIFKLLIFKPLLVGSGEKTQQKKKRDFLISCTTKKMLFLFLLFFASATPTRPTHLRLDRGNAFPKQNQVLAATKLSAKVRRWGWCPSSTRPGTSATPRRRNNVGTRTKVRRENFIYFFQPPE